MQNPPHKFPNLEHGLGSRKKWCRFIGFCIGLACDRVVTDSGVGMQGLKDRGYTLQDNEAEQLVSHLDTDTNGAVDYLDWLAAMVDWHKVPCLMPHMRQASLEQSQQTEYGLCWACPLWAPISDTASL